MALKSKSKAKTKIAAKAKSKTKAVAKSKPKTKVAAKAKTLAKAKVKSKTKPKAKPTAKPKAKTSLKAKTVAKPAKSAAKAKAKTIVKSKVAAGKVKTQTQAKMLAPVKSKAAAKPKAAPKPKVILDVQKTTYRPLVGSGGPIDFVPYQEGKSEDYMNPQQSEHFRKILRNWLAQLREEVDNTMAHMQEEMGTYPDPVDRAAQEEEFSLELRARDRERKLIKKIEQAIDDIDHNDYGYCKDCGAEIGIRRLEARPTADKCIDCKTFEEIKEKQIGA